MEWECHNLHTDIGLLIVYGKLLSAIRERVRVGKTGDGSVCGSLRLVAWRTGFLEVFV